MSEILNKNIEMGKFVHNTMVQTFSKILCVNLNTGAFEVVRNDGLLDDLNTEGITDIYAYIKTLIEEGVIYPEYATACRRFTNPEYVRKSIFSDNRRLVQSYRRRTLRGDKWITFGIIPGPDCGPENPVALFTWREAESDVITLFDTLPTISSLYDKLIRINLTNNTYEPVIVDADEQERLVGGVINMYEWWADYSRDGNIAEEDMGEFKTLTKTGSLQKRFAEDPTPVSFRYRRKVGDEYRWVQLQIAPSVEYSEENQIMLLSLKDVHEEYTEEIRKRQELIDNMHTDALTGLFNRLKFNADIDDLMKNNDEAFICLYVDVNGLHELNNTLGHQKGDDMLCCVADALRTFFPDENVYRIGGDEFVVTSTSLTKDEVESAVVKMRKELLRDNYEVSVGIASGEGEKNAEKIVMAAEVEMRKDKSAYYMSRGDRRKNRQMNKELEQILEEKRNNERFLDIVSRQFSCVYFVDLASDLARPIYNSPLYPKLIKETDGSFSAVIRQYAEEFVEAEYHGRFDEILDYDRLDQKLRNRETVEITYQKLNGDRMIIRILEVDRPQDAKPETIWMFWKEYEL